MNTWAGDRLIQLLPAEGWGVLFDGDGRADVGPLAAWGLLANGETVPLWAEQAIGVLSDPRECVNFVSLLDPMADADEAYRDWKETRRDD